MKCELLPNSVLASLNEKWVEAWLSLLEQFWKHYWCTNGLNGLQDIWSQFRWQIQVNVLENLTDELIYKGIECMADFLVLKLEETRGLNVSNNHFIYVY